MTTREIFLVYCPPGTTFSIDAMGGLWQRQNGNSWLFAGVTEAKYNGVQCLLWIRGECDVESAAIMRGDAERIVERYISEHELRSIAKWLKEAP